MQTNPFPAMDMEAPPGAQVPVGAAPLGVPADPAAFARGAADPPKKPAKGKKTRRASRVSNTGSDDDEAADSEQRRKRQREANLQAQRRCRERHRTHVTNLEAEVDALRAKADAATAESARLQASLQRSLMGLEECQQRWQTMEQEKVNMRQMKEYAEAKLAQTLEALRECASKNGALVDELRRRSTRADAAAAAVAPEGDDSTSLQRDAAEVELKAKAGEASESEMKRIALRLSRQFRTYLVDGNACSSAQAFTSPESDVSTAGPGQTRSVFKRAHKVARSLDLSDAQRAQIVQLWKAHSGKLHALFERRKKLTADALMLQGSSPVATLVDFLSIGSGTLSGVRNEEELAEQGGSMTLTGFAQHACRLQGVISELRENIGAEQKQNFVLVSEVVDDVLTPMQTCTICATWGTECPDMLAISRAVTVQTMEANGAAR
jgi:hypothetical protein